MKSIFGWVATGKWETASDGTSWLQAKQKLGGKHRHAAKLTAKVYGVRPDEMLILAAEKT